MATMSISVVKGRGSMAHNNREFSTQNVDKERTQNNIIYKAEPIEQAYNKLFQEEVDRYNVGKKPCRQIPDYMEHIRQSKNGEKLFYETVVQVGNKFDCSVGSEMGEKAKAVLNDYMKDFQERNPNLYVFNAVMHLDEATPHLHIDYIPVAHGYKQGLQVRNSLDKALKEQGIGGKANKKENSTHNWQEGEKDHIEKFLKEHGLERAEEKGLKRQHMTVEQYKTVAEQVNQAIKQIPEQIVSSPTLLNKDKVTVNKKDLEKLEHRAKLSAIHEKTTKELVNNVRETLNLTQQGYQNIKGKELNLENQKDEFERFRASKTKDLESLRRDLEQKIEEQRDLNRKYNILNIRYDDLDGAYKQVCHENKELKQQLKDLRNEANRRMQENIESAKSYIFELKGQIKEQAQGYEKKIENLTQRLQGMAEVVKNITQAVGLFKYDKGEYNADLTRKQSKLVDAVAEYAKTWIERDGGAEVDCEAHKAEINQRVGISKGLKSFITPEYEEIIYYKGSQGYGFYASKAEGGEYLGSKTDYKELKETFPTAKFKDPYEHIPAISGYERSL